MLMDGCRAENGCFIKPRPSRSGNSSWINMIVNFNLTWKSSCLEILHYVCCLPTVVIIIEID
jgi:hypothetical protein